MTQVRKYSLGSFSFVPFSDDSIEYRRLVPHMVYPPLFSSSCQVAPWYVLVYGETCTADYITFQCVYIFRDSLWLFNGSCASPKEAVDTVNNLMRSTPLVRYAPTVWNDQFLWAGAEKMTIDASTGVVVRMTRALSVLQLITAVLGRPVENWGE